MQQKFSLSDWLEDKLSAIVNKACMVKEDYLTLPHVVGLLLVGVVGYFFFPEFAIHQPPGILVPQAPFQMAMTPDTAAFSYKGYSITPLATYDITARVLAKKTYFWGRDADIAPVDLTLSWQEMSDSAILKHFSFHLSGRYYTSHWNVSVLPDATINREVANNHLIPSSKGIERFLRHARVGQVVHLKGYLVRVNASDGYSWTSSLTREDSGMGACELMYVESAS